MGGDLGPAVVLSAVLSVLREDPLLSVDLFGDEHQLAGMMASAGLSVSGDHRLTIHHAPDAVDMTDSPVHALRHKKHSSMRMALERLQSGQASACLSAGNTGALVLMSHHLLKTLPGVERAAMCTLLPSPDGYTFLLDVGATVEVTPALLLQHAKLGTAMARHLDGCTRPRVGLLNVGVEAGKGPMLMCDADALLRACADIEYRGFVEGNDLFAGTVEVVVTDGFTGNIALKASEGAARLVSIKVADYVRRHPLLGLLAGILRPLLKGLKSELDPESFNGACLLGLQGVVVKSHGASSERGMAQSLRLAARLGRSSLISDGMKVVV
jgi:glycerol-3-phosphate acyltransferase PlsX